MLKILPMFGILLLICFFAAPVLYAQDSKDTPAWYQSVFFSAGLPLYFSPESHFGSVKPGFGFRGAIGYEWKGKLLRPSVALSSGWSRFPETDRLVESLSFVPVTGRAGFLWPFKEPFGLQADIGLGMQISKTIHYETELDLWSKRQSESTESKLFTESRLYIAYMPVPDFLKIYAGGGVDMVFETDGLVPLPVLEAGVSIKPFAHLSKKEASPPRERKERPPREPRERRERQPRERKQRERGQVRERAITFMSNGGTNVPAQTVANGGKANTPDIFRENYTLEGWYRDRKTTRRKWNFDTDSVTRNITLYAKWTGNLYTITYQDVDGDTFSGRHEIGYATTHTYGTETALAGAAKTGHDFGGWFINSNGTGTALASLSATDYTEDINLYAHWIPVSYAITYLDVGNEALSGTHGIDYPAAHTYGTETYLVDPEKEYFTFEGWFINSDGTGTAMASLSATDYTDVITLYAKWTEPLPLRYAVYFKGERGWEANLDVTDEMEHETSDTIEDDDISERLLQRAGERLRDNPNTHIWLHGYAAPVGTTDGQIATSAARVRHCAEYLMRNYGIPENRMHQDFHGAQPPDMKRVFPHLDPPPSPNNEEYYQYWRRVELIVDVFN